MDRGTVSFGGNAISLPCALTHGRCFMSPRHLIACSVLLSVSLGLAGCKHPLAIEGQGDVIELRQDLRGCALEEFHLAAGRCTDNTVSEDESPLYQALPRPGWVFDHWQDCPGDVTETTCSAHYLADWAALWDSDFPEVPGPTLRAVFVEDRKAVASQLFLGASFGTQGRAAFGAVLETQVSADGYYRHTRQIARTRSYYSRTPVAYARRDNGLLYTAITGAEAEIAGWAPRAFDLFALVDSDASDNEIGVSWHTPQLEDADNSLLNGSYYCGRISTNGAGEFSQLILNGKGAGVIKVLEERRGQTGQASVSYSVTPYGAVALSWGSLRLNGGVSSNGDVITASQIESGRRGAAVCIRANAGKSLLNVASSYLGAWISLQPMTAVTELLVDTSGTTAEAVALDSAGGRAYSIGQDWMLVNWDGKLATSSNHGAISADGRFMFIIRLNPGGFPALVFYSRKSA
jgi:hypothetical protein